MKSYICFLFKTILMKKSFYFTFLITFLMEILILYILPFIVKQKILDLIGNPFILTIFTFSLVIISTMLSIMIFKTSIDDGTEILLLSKPITRSFALWSKLIVLLTFLLSQSLIIFIIALFLPFSLYGISNPIYIGSGFFFVSLIGSIFFSSIAILLSLVFKQSISILINVGISFLFLVWFIVVQIISVPVQKNLENKGYYLTTMNLLQKKNKDGSQDNLMNASALTLDGNFIHDKTNLPTEVNKKENILNEIYNKELSDSNFYKFYLSSPFNQWTSLLNLANFYSIRYYTNEQIFFPNLNFSSDFKNPSIISFKSPTNQQLDSLIKLNIKNIPEYNNLNLYVSTQNFYKYATHQKGIWLINRFLRNQTENTIFGNILIPLFEFNQNGQYIQNSLKFKLFNFKDENLFQKVFNNIFDNTNNESLFSKFQTWDRYFKFKNNNYAFLDFIYQYYFLANTAITKEISKNPNAKINIVDEQNKSISMTYNDFKNQLLSLANIHKNRVGFNLYEMDLSIINKETVALVSLWLNLSNELITNIKLYLVNYLVSLPEIDYNVHNHKLIIDFLFKNKPNYFLFNEVTLNRFMALNNEYISNNNTLSDKKWKEYGALKRNTEVWMQHFLSFSLMPENQISYSLSIATINNLIDPVVLISIWLLFGFISLSISSMIYVRKDIQ